MPSPITSDATRASLQPIVLSSASSPWRSSTDIAIVLVTLIAPITSATITITSVALWIRMLFAPARAASAGVPITVVFGELRA